jgi:hypothetical protein
MFQQWVLVNWARHAGTKIKQIEGLDSAARVYTAIGDAARVCVRRRHLPGGLPRGLVAGRVPAFGADGLAGG